MLIVLLTLDMYVCATGSSEASGTKSELLINLGLTRPFLNSGTKIQIFF